MKETKKDLRAWGDRCGAKEVEGLTEEMRREVVLVAVTPTKQEVASSVGREVRNRSETLRGLGLWVVVVLLFTCDTSFLHVADNRSA